MRVVTNNPTGDEKEKKYNGSTEKDLSKLFLSIFPEEEEYMDENNFAADPEVEENTTAYDLQLRDYLDNYIAREKAKSNYSMLTYGDTIAQVESGNNPRAIQMGGGPGRGKYQFEPAGAITASNRLVALSESLGFENPSWNTLENMKDVSKLTAEQQDILFLADKLQDADTDLGALSRGDISGEDFWIKHHWKGNASGNNPDDELARRLHYREIVNWMKEGEE